MTSSPLFSSSEKYKIREYSEYAVILPSNDKYENCMFFFAGFNENASKYIYLFKFFLESLAINKSQYPLIKIIIPFLPTYPIKDNASIWVSNPNKFTHLLCWYSLEIQNGSRYKLVHNKEKNDFIIKMVNKEINKLGSSQNIIFCGFSMGGRYLLELLSLMKIKTKFNITFKSALLFYQNQHIDDIIFTENKFYVYYSVNDKIIPFNRCFESVNSLKKNGFKNVNVKVDNRRDHVVDGNCLRFLEKVFRENFDVRMKAKF